MKPRRSTVGVQVGKVGIGGKSPIAVQSMTNTDTADVEATSKQIIQLANAGSELVRITVSTSAAAAAVPEIRKRVVDAGCDVPIIGDFHYNGHILLTEFPECAEALDKYRINPGNTGSARTSDANFTRICKIASERNKAIRIGVNSGSLDQNLVIQMMRENTEKSLGLESDEVLNQCMIISALQSTELALQAGLRKDQIILSAKSSVPRHLINLYRELSRRTDQPLHLGLTEAGMGVKGIVWSIAPMAVLLEEGIGDTIRVSLTPRPGGDRCEEVHAACELLQSLGLRSFAPSITACPGCGRTTSAVFQELACRVQDYIRERLPDWRAQYEGFESLTLAVMGCIVNGPGESKAANIGISLPGTGEAPQCPVYIDGKLAETLNGTPEEVSARFAAIIEKYVKTHYSHKG